MFTRSVFKTSLAFTIFALVLLPQIAATGTVLAAKPTTKPATSPSLAVANLYCLDVTGSTTLLGNVVPVPTPPGQAVQFTVLPRVANNCTTTVSGITVTYMIKPVCPSPSISNAKPSTFKPDKPLASGQSVGDFDGGIVPITSEAPTSISVDISATGTDATGQEVFSPDTVTVPF
jgi:hypothetical protein